jgi:DnaK suppressor protein
MPTRRQTAKKTQRNAELRKMLEQRRDELRMQVHGRMRDIRSQSRHHGTAPGHDEMLEVDVREDIDAALIQMTSETLGKIDVALRRLEQGAYGNCSECDSQITEARLRALPFATRCRECEAVREKVPHASQRATSRLFDLA